MLLRMLLLFHLHDITIRMVVLVIHIWKLVA
jgi:hypothetical protein